MTTYRIGQVAYPGQVALAALVYLVAAKLSLALAIPPGYATAVWPPSGIALAAGLLLGGRIWPGIWIGAALANVAVESSFFSAALIASGNTAEALAGAALMRRHAIDPGRFERGEDVVKFILLCALSAGIAASVALAPLASGRALPWEQVLRNWWTWWQGDLMGMIIVAPLLLSLAARSAVPWPPQRKVEAACFWALLLAAAAAITAGDATQLAPFSLTLVTLPFMLWAAFRFGQREVSSAIAVVCALAVWYTLESRDLFASVLLNEWLLMLLSFVTMVVTTGLVLVAVLGERGRAVAELREKHYALAQDHTEKAGRLAYLAAYDPLTGLANGALFRERLAQLVGAAGERGGKVAVAVMGIERFKAINDALGAQAGDALLKQIATRMLPDVGSSGLVARLGGVQFAIAGGGFESESAVARAAERRLSEWFGAPYVIGDHELRLSARMGLTLFPDDGAQPDTLLLHAESALKKAKACGEHYLFYTREMSERVAENLSLEHKLRRAIERQEFVLHYQPKVDLDSRRVVGLEALLRWESPELGLVPPMQFIPLLEETALILEVGSWALSRAVLDRRRWNAQGVRAPRIAVNVSSIQLRQRNFVELVQQAIGPAGGPDDIELEITESRIMDDIEANIGKLRRLCDLGVRIAIDDFGTGYSSLAYLAKLPAQTLKIDRSFIARMLDDDEAMALVQMIISLAKSLSLDTVAEGVESEAQAAVLEMLRCDQMQGYLFSQALPFDGVTALLQRDGRDR